MRTLTRALLTLLLVILGTAGIAHGNASAGTSDNTYDNTSGNTSDNMSDDGGQMPPRPVSSDLGDVEVTPAAGSELNWSPREFTLTFPDDPTDVTVTLTDADGYHYPPAKPADIDGETLTFHPPQIFEGTYQIAWDGPHAGSYQFSVLGATQIEPIGPTGELNPGIREPATTPNSGTGTGVVFAVGGTLAALCLLIAAAKRRKLALLAAGAVIAVTAVAGVTLDAQPASADRAICLSEQGERRIQCLADVAVEAYENGGVPGAIDELHGLAEDPRFLAGTGENVCHTVAHVVAREIVSQEGSIAKVAGDGDTTCGSGFLHGAVEGGAVLVGSDIFTEEIQGICGDSDSEQAIQCAHGIGHGAALRFNTRIEESADVCFSLPNEAQAVQCLLGATMVTGDWFANMAARTTVLADMAPPDAKAGQIGEACLAERFLRTPERFKACLEGLFNYVKPGPENMSRMAAPWNSLDAVASWCSQIEADHPSIGSGCFSSLGTASALRLWAEPADTPQICHRADNTESRKACTVSVVTQVRNNQRQAPGADIFEAVCANAPEDAQTLCREHAERLINRSLD